MECCCHISQKPYQEQERYWQSSAVHRHRRLYLQQRYSNLLKSWIGLYKKSWCKDYSFLKWEPLHHERSVYECTFRFDMHYKKTKRVSSLFDGIRLFLFISLSSIFFLIGKAHYKTSIIDMDNVIIRMRHCHTAIRFQVWKSSLILFLSTIDVKKQSSMGLFFFYPNLSEFLCNRFRKGAQPNGMDKRDIYLWACAAFPNHSSQLHHIWELLVR